MYEFKGLKEINILHLPKWYPNRTDDLFGIFSKRHIKCTLPHTKPVVVFGTVDGNLEKTYEIEFNEEEGIPTYRFYYKKRFTKISFLDRLIKIFLYFFLLRKCILKIDCKIDLVHVHVMTRSAIYALFMKWTKQIPFIITEHWTIYLPQKRKYLSSWRRSISAFLTKRSNYLTTVSNNLLEALNDLKIFCPNGQAVIGNSINTEIFKLYPKEKDGENNNFITVVEFNEEAKNIKGLIKAFEQLKERPYHLHIVGYGKDEQLVKNYAKEINASNITFYPKMYAKDLGPFMSSKDCFILNSRVENLPCVIIEAHACGLPVISTDVGGIAEMINEENGVLVTSGNGFELIGTIESFHTNQSKYNRNSISKTAISKYSEQEIGRAFNKIYQDVI